MKVAIIGSGISGLVCAYLLDRSHDVTVFEASGKPGGHVHTVDTKGKNRSHRVDMGFIVFNEGNYPGFCKLLEQLGVESQTTRMGFSVSDESLGIEYSGESKKGMFGSLRNIVDPFHHKMVLDIIRFHKVAKMENLKEGETVSEFVTLHHLGRRFQTHYLYPLGSALWSCPEDTFASFPMEFAIDFFSNHKMLQVKGRPVWRVVKGGSMTYVDKIVDILGDCIRLNSPVQSVVRMQESVEIITDHGMEAFDEVILACHANQSLRLLQSATPDEREALESFPYEKNEVLLHTDTSVLPQRTSAWASWNAKTDGKNGGKSTVSYSMNILQGLEDETQFCVSLNQGRRVNKDSHIEKVDFSHPTFSKKRKAVQSRHSEFIRNDRVSFCGAYWGYGFHEDGLQSGLRVCKAFGEELV